MEMSQEQADKIIKMLEEAKQERASQGEVISEIHLGLYGNEKNKQKGLVEKVEEHGKYISRSKKLKWIFLGISFGIGASTTGGDNIFQIIKKMFGY